MTATVDVSRRPDIEAWLDEQGIRWTYESELPLGEVDHVAGLVNQARQTPLDDNVVARYAADMIDGDRFPAVIVRQVGHDLIPADGNHRLAGARRADRGTHPAYIVTCDDLQARRLAVFGNRKHGLPFTDAERLWHAIELTHTLTVEEAAAEVGLPVTTLRRQLAANRTARRAVKLDVDGWNDLSTSTKAQLDSIGNDQVFTRALELVAGGTVLASEVGRFVARLNTLEPKQALEEIADVERHNAGRVRRGVGRPPSPLTSPRKRFLGDLDALMAQLHPRSIAFDVHDDDERAQVLGQIQATARWLMSIEQAVQTPKGAR